MVAANTLDDFVRSVLETKATLITAVVEGRALAPDLSGDVLDELQRTIRTIAAGIADSGDAATDDVIDRLLAQARRRLDARGSPGPATARTAEEDEAFRRALAALANALAPPPVERYRLASTSHAGVEHELTIDGADVICSCPGFEFRGQCKHARDLKAALAAGAALPAGYRKE